jgi:hypothetical protein
VLDNVMDRDHAWMVQPGGGSRLAHRARCHSFMLGRRQVGGQQYFLDRNETVELLVAAMPHPPQATSPSRLAQQVTPANQDTRLP